MDRQITFAFAASGELIHNESEVNYGFKSSSLPGFERGNKLHIDPAFMAFVWETNCSQNVHNQVYQKPASIIGQGEITRFAEPPASTFNSTEPTILTEKLNETKFQTQTAPAVDHFLMPHVASTPIRRQLSMIDQNSEIQRNQNLSQILTQNQTFTESFSQSMLDQSMVTGIPTFDGDKTKFRSWLHQIECLKDTLDEDKVLKILRRKIGAEPFEFLQTKPQVGLADTIKSLVEEYDPIGDSKNAAARYYQLRQGSKSLTTHNATVVSLLKIMGKDTDTKDESLISPYISSLTDKRHKVSMYQKWIGSQRTLREIMQAVKERERAAFLANGCVDVPQYNNSASRVLTVSSDESAHEETGELATLINLLRNATGNSNQNFKRPNNGTFCDIHQSTTHSTKDCRENDRDTCRFCKVKVGKHKIAEHMAACTAPKCYKCGRIGHKAFQCRMGGNGHSTGNFMKRTKKESTVTPTKVAKAHVVEEITESGSEMETAE